MNEKYSLYDIAGILAERTGRTTAMTERFIEELIDIINDGITKDQSVKIKGLGSLNIILVKERESVHVNTGERILIPAHHKLSFLPDKGLKELINKPFSSFEAVEINAGGSDVEYSLDTSSEYDDDDDEMLPPVPERTDPPQNEPAKTPSPVPDDETTTLISTPVYSMPPVPETGVSDRWKAPEIPPTTDETTEIMEKPLPEDESTVAYVPPLKPAAEAPEPFKTDVPADGDKPASESAAPDGETTSIILPPRPKTIAEKYSEERALREAGKGSENAEEKPETNLSDENEATVAIPSSPQIKSRDTIEHTGTSAVTPPPYSRREEKRRKKKKSSNLSLYIIIIFMFLIACGSIWYFFFFSDTYNIFRPGQNGLVKGESFTLPGDSDAIKDSEEKSKVSLDTLALTGRKKTGDAGLSADSVATAVQDSIAKAATTPKSDGKTAPPDAEAGKTARTKTDSSSVVKPNQPQDVNVSSSGSKVLAKVRMDPGSRLTLIAEKYYGNKLFWVYIYEFNKAKIGPNPNRIPTNMEILVPKKEVYNIDANNSLSVEKARLKQSEIISKIAND
ncbi:MAG: HU family DNA-binding protein [Tannerella sp.]|jgi:nucleoid DNA-binding protein/flagellar basal body-associated protein FliL|nr:HU family DNA-binding protein [Tannerella sp.]